MAPRFSGAVIAFPLLSLAAVYLGGAMLAWTGRWLGGQAPSAHLRAVVAWSWIPGLIGTLAGVPLLTLSRFFQGLSTGPLASVASFWVSALSLVASLLGLIIQVKGIQEVQGFSLGRAIANLLAPIAAVMGLVFSLMMVVVILALAVR